MAKRIGPEAKIISLFTALPEDSKRIVMDVLKAQTATPRKVAARKPEKVSKVDMCAICGGEKPHIDHQESSPNYHIFRTSIKQKGKPNGEDKLQGVTA